MAPIYEYEAKNKDGKKRSGKLEAASPIDVANELRKEGFFITSIKEDIASKKKDIQIRFGKRVKINDIALFSQQFSVMINAGIPLINCLNILHNQTENEDFKKVIADLEENVKTGASLSEAMQRHPKIFPDIYCYMIQAGEAGGVLDKVLAELTKHYQKQNELNSQIKSAMYYPITILVATIGALFFLLAKVVPNFLSIFSEFDAELPMPTQMLLKLSNLMESYWWVILIFFGITGVIFYKYTNTPKGKYRFHSFILKSPLFGKMIRKIAISRFSSTLSVLLNSGVNLLLAIDIVENVVENQVIATVLEKAKIQLRGGTNLSIPLEESGEFPDMVVQMIKIGEETGQLDNMLTKISDFYEKETEIAIEGLVSLIEPLMIFFMAGAIGTIAVAIMLPMFDLISTIG
ncbi:MAG: type II secretion system F family protein [bacterium]